MTTKRPIRNLALIGFMGTGKSSVGRLVADLMHFTFLDTDHVIEARAAAQAAARAETDTLSAREVEVLQALSKGHTYKQIAGDLGISLGTVRTYIQRIYEKLHVHSHGEAVMKFARK